MMEKNPDKRGIIALKGIIKFGGIVAVGVRNVQGVNQVKHWEAALTDFVSIINDNA
jgi:hypothetical protein